MKIAHITSTFPPYYAGIGNVAYHLCWELSQRNCRVTVFTIGTRSDPELDQSLPFIVKRLRPFIWYGNAGFVPQLIAYLHGYDIIHLHYPFFGGAEMVYLRDTLKRLNLIVHYHMDVVGEGVKKRLFAWHSRHIMPAIIKNARRIIVTTDDYVRQSLIRDHYEQRPEQFAVIPLGVNPDVFKLRRKDQRLLRKYHLTDKKIILFVGTLDRAHYFKGVNYLIKAFQLISSNDEYRLMLVGSGNLRSSYESIVSNFGLERKVIFAGTVPDDVVPLYYNLADIFVLPSIDSSEAFGVTLLEAMASEIPVITSDLPGVRSVVDRGTVGLLVKAKQVDTLAKQMLYLLKNPNVRNRLGRAGRARVLEHFTWARVGDQVHDLYRECIQ